MCGAGDGRSATGSHSVPAAREGQGEESVWPCRLCAEVLPLGAQAVLNGQVSFGTQGTGGGEREEAVACLFRIVGRERGPRGVEHGWMQGLP